MKWKNSFKKGSLAAFVTLALTGSALAMPTGGTVENGSVNVDAANFGANDAIANVANGATITPQTNSIINWEAFNIAQGEALHFNTTNAALLNRVTGAQMSELLGQMTQVGGNFLYLINPNGIHIGGTASFDVSNLTLSTLNVASEDFLSYVTAAKPYLPSQQDAVKGAKAITVDQGAHFNAAGPLMLQASKVTVADGVTFVATPSPMPHAFYIRAAKSNSGSDNTTKTEAGNDVVFRGEAKNFDIISMLGSNITLDGAKLAGKNINMDAVGTFTMNPVVSENSYTMTAAPTNTLTVKNTQIAGDEVELRGGKVDVADDVKFRFNADNHDADLTVAAVKSYFDDNQGSYKVATEQGNDVSFHGTVESGGNYRTDMGIGGATVNLDRAKFHTPNGELSANAVQSSEDKADGTWEDTATSANVVQADGLEIVGNRNDTEFWGGKVELKNTTIKTPGEVQVYAYKTFKEGSIDTKDMTAGADSVVQLTNTKILNEGSDPQAYSNVWVRGGKIEMNNSELASEDEIRLTASNSLHEVRAEGHIPKELKMEANAENTIRLSNTQLHANQASWQPSSEARYTPKGSIGIYGGKVDVAKDVNFKFAAGANEANLDVAAVSNIVEKPDGDMQASTTQGNDTAFHGTVESDADRDAEVNIGGATVNMDGAKFRMPKGDLSVVAIASSEDSYAEDAGVEKETALTKATAANVVQADGLDVEGNLHGTQIYGGKVDLKNTTVKTPGKIEIEAYTSREWTGKNRGDIIEKNLRAGTDNVVRLENTKLLSAAAEANGWIKWVQIYGGAVDIKDSELTSDHCVDVRALQSMDEVLLKDSPDSSHWYFPNYTTQKGEYHAGAENYLQISNSKLHANLASWNKYERPDCYVSAIGGKTSLKDVDMKSARDIDVYALREAHMIDEPSHKSEVKHDTSSTVTMHNTTMEAKGKSEIFGGKLHLKGSSLQAGKIDVRAGETNKTTGSTNSTTASTTASTTGTNNTLYLEDTKLQGKENSIMHREGAVYLLGGQVSLKKAEIHTVGENSRVLIYSGQMEHCDPSLWTEQFYMPKGMPLYMDSTKITTPFYHSHSGTAHLMNGTGIEGDQIVFSAAQMFDFRDMYDYKISLTKDNVVSLWDSKIKSRHSAMKFEAGGLQAWKGSEAESGWIDYLNGNIERTDGSTFTMQRDESSRISETAHPELSVTVATAPAMPTFPMFPLTPDNAPLSAQDEENIAAGKSEAQGIIASAADTEAQGKALAEAVGKLNNVPNASSRQKAGVVTGMIQAINEMNTLTTEEKHALQVAVLDAYGAVQEAKTEVSNRTQQANDDAMRLTTMESASANMPTAEEPQDAVHFAG